MQFTSRRWRVLALGVLACGSCTGADSEVAEPDETVTLQTDPFVVHPGEEVWRCQDFASPFGENEAEVSEWSVEMSPGSHHLLLFFKDDAVDGPVEDCNPLEFGAFAVYSMGSSRSQTFPDGVAAYVPAGQGFHTNLHIVNSTNDDLTSDVKVIARLAKPETVKARAGVIVGSTSDINVAPHSSQTVTDACTIPDDVHLISMASHMHRHGTQFTAAVGDDTVYRTETWAEPPLKTFDPSLALSKGKTVDYSCTFQNDGDTTLEFGDSAVTDEMCAFFGTYYPVPQGADPAIMCGSSFTNQGPPSGE